MLIYWLKGVKILNYFKLFFRFHVEHCFPHTFSLSFCVIIFVVRYPFNR